MNSETKFFTIISGATIFIVLFALFFLSKPSPTWSREDLVPPEAHTKGNRNARVYLVEFSDFQCPACLLAKPIVDQIVSEYQDNIVFAYRHFPLDQHPFGEQTARIAEAAALQGKFWEAYELLFQNQSLLSESFLSTVSAQLNLNAENFVADIESPVVQQRVQRDRSDGVRFGVDATPTFFLNGKKLNLSSFADLKIEIEKALQ